MPITILKTRDGKLDQEDRAKFDALKQRLAANASTVLLHIHGGLVNEALGVAAALRLSGESAYSYNAPDDYEQVYVVWRTGAFETIKTNWRDLFENDRLYGTLFRRLLPYVTSRVGVNASTGAGITAAAEASVESMIPLSPSEVERRLNSGSDAPFEDIDALASETVSAARFSASAANEDANEEEFERIIAAEVEGMLRYDEEFNQIADAIAEAAAPDESFQLNHSSGLGLSEGTSMLNRLDSNIETELRAKAPEAAGLGLLSFVSVKVTLIKHVVKVALRVFRRIRRGRHHKFHATIVEELVRVFYGDLIGATVWGMMKTDAADHFADDGMGGELIDIISAGDHRLILSGHSAGAIWASEFTKAAAGSISEIEMHLLAPAIRTVEFADMLAQASASIASLRIFTMSDEYERRDPVLGPRWGKIYPSSLLYVISGILEERQSRSYADAPILGMERFIAPDPSWIQERDERAAIGGVRTYLASLPIPVTYSVIDGGPDQASGAIAHGDFDNDPPTLSSIAHYF